MIGAYCFVGLNWVLLIVQMLINSKGGVIVCSILCLISAQSLLIQILKALRSTGITYFKTSNHLGQVVTYLTMNYYFIHRLADPAKIMIPWDDQAQLNQSIILAIANIFLLFQAFRLLDSLAGLNASYFKISALCKRALGEIRVMTLVFGVMVLVWCIGFQLVGLEYEDQEIQETPHFITSLIRTYQSSLGDLQAP
jgi:hypothetical protein